MRWATVMVTTVLLVLGGADAGWAQADGTRPATPTFWGDTGLWFVPTGEVLPRRRVLGVGASHRARLPAGQYQRVVLPGHRRASASGVPKIFGSMRVITRIDRDTVPLLFAGPDDEAGGLVNEYPTVHETWTGNKLGDLFLGAKMNLTSQQHQWPLALALRGTLKFPTGDRDAGAGTGEYDGFVDVIGSGDVGGVEVAGFGGVALRGDPDDISISDGLRWGAGVGFPSRRQFRATAEVHGEWMMDDDGHRPCRPDRRRRRVVVAGDVAPRGPRSTRPSGSPGSIRAACCSAPPSTTGSAWRPTARRASRASDERRRVRRRVPDRIPSRREGVRPAAARGRARRTRATTAAGTAAPAAPVNRPPDGARRLRSVHTRGWRHGHDPRRRDRSRRRYVDDRVVRDRRHDRRHARGDDAVDGGDRARPGHVHGDRRRRPRRPRHRHGDDRGDRRRGRAFEDVLFDFDSSRLRPEMLPRLDPVLAALTAEPGDGARDRRPHLQHRHDRVQPRRLATAARTRCATTSCRAVSRLPGCPTVTYGEERPAHDNSQESTRRLNRRAVLVVHAPHADSSR